MTHLSWKVAALSLAASCAAPQPNIPHQHKRAIVEREGGTFLWAGEDDAWFDVTDARIDPTRFQYGIGKDTIPSIDEPVFASFEDPRIAEAGLTLETPVLGVVIDGVARAYPVHIMDHHEIVNDDFGGTPYAVLW